MKADEKYPIQSNIPIHDNIYECEACRVCS